MSGGTKYNNRFGNIEIYAVAKIELVMAFPGNRNANAAAWKDIFFFPKGKGRKNEKKSQFNKYIGCPILGIQDINLILNQYNSL